MKPKPNNTRRTISGKPESTERLHFESDLQRKLHSVLDYIKATPGNFLSTDEDIRKT